MCPFRDQVFNSALGLASIGLIAGFGRPLSAVTWLRLLLAGVLGVLGPEGAGDALGLGKEAGWASLCVWVFQHPPQPAAERPDPAEG